MSEWKKPQFRPGGAPRGQVPNAPSSGEGSELNRRGLPKAMEGPAAMFMPPHVAILFLPDPPQPQIMHLRKKKASAGVRSTLQGVGNAMEIFESNSPAPVVVKQATPMQLRSHAKLMKKLIHEKELAEAISKWNPKADPKITGDAYKTLFVARLSYDTTEFKLQKEMEVYGPILRTVIVKDSEGLSRGYGYVEFKYEDDLKVAYRKANGLRIDNRRILVDVERGRTVRGWLPRRLGGGKGDPRPTKLSKRAMKQTGRVFPPTGRWKLIASIQTKEELIARMLQAKRDTELLNEADKRSNRRSRSRSR
jgi:U1 small nuclear ribonucleoprotein 70kDa